MRSVLIAEDEPLLAFELADALALAGIASFVAHSNRSACCLVQSETIDVAIVDLCLRDGSAEPTIALLETNGIPVLIYSGIEPEESHIAIRKPCTPQAVIDAVERVLAIKTPLSDACTTMGAIDEHGSRSSSL